MRRNTESDQQSTAVDIAFLVSSSFLSTLIIMSKLEFCPQKIENKIKVFMTINLSGRSARDHTININMARVRQMEVNMNNPRSDTGMTITVGTGRPWREIYEEVRKL